MLLWWLDSGDPRTAEEIHTTFRRLATHGVENFIIALAVIPGDDVAPPEHG
jgi:hypothetical protein